MRKHGKSGCLPCSQLNSKAQLLQSPNRIAPCPIRILEGEEVRAGLMATLAIGQHMQDRGQDAALGRDQRLGLAPTDY